MNFFKLLGESDDRDLFQTKLRQFSTRRVELTFAAVY